MSNKKLATLGAGCFWCVEAVFQNLRGVEKVVSGYCGGHVRNPTYKQICSGSTGHAEVCQITFDSERVAYDEILEVFFNVHNPTTLNKQGNDEGTQYRSVIFYHNEEQKEIALTYTKQLDASGTWPNPIVTEISPVAEFYPAEDYHQNYYNDNSNTNPYCRLVVRPKVEKFKKLFPHKGALWWPREKSFCRIGMQGM